MDYISRSLEEIKKTQLTSAHGSYCSTAESQRPADSLSPVFNQLLVNDNHGPSDAPLEKGIPILIMWSHGGNEIAVQGSWDNWTSRKTLHRSGKDHSVLLVLPSGIYHYKFIVDGEWRHIPVLPSIADEMGVNLSLTSFMSLRMFPRTLMVVNEFEHPHSPIASHAHTFSEDEENAKETPVSVVLALKSSSSAGTSLSSPAHFGVSHPSSTALSLIHRAQRKLL